MSYVNLSKVHIKDALRLIDEIESAIDQIGEFQGDESSFIEYVNNSIPILIYGLRKVRESLGVPFSTKKAK